MPCSEVHIFCEADGQVPLLTWLESLVEREPRAYAKCLERILSLAQHGNELRRPVADHLRNGVYELRMVVGGVQYRILYGFIGRSVALLSHGITKTRKVPPLEIDRAARNLKMAKADPERHTAEFDLE